MGGSARSGGSGPALPRLDQGACPYDPGGRCIRWPSMWNRNSGGLVTAQRAELEMQAEKSSQQVQGLRDELEELTVASGSRPGWRKIRTSGPGGNDAAWGCLP